MATFWRNYDKARERKAVLCPTGNSDFLIQQFALTRSRVVICVEKNTRSMIVKPGLF